VVFEDSFIYYPSKYPEGRWDLAGAAARGDQEFQIEDRIITTGDGIRIHGWLCSPGHVEQASSSSLLVEPELAAGENQPQSNASSVSPFHSRTASSTTAEPMILFFHGNAGNVTDRYELIRTLMEIPARVFVLDYRGYGKSEGIPSEPGLYIDAMAAWDFLTRDLQIAPANIAIYGESLGGAVAIDLAAQVNPGGLIVQSSFTSMSDMVSHVAPGFPRFLLHTRMDSIGKVNKIRCPKLFAHGQADELVPFDHCKRLCAASGAPTQFYEIPGAGHNDVFETGGKAYLDKLRVFVNQSCSQ